MKRTVGFIINSCTILAMVAFLLLFAVQGGGWLFVVFGFTGGIEAVDATRVLAVRGTNGNIARGGIEFCSKGVGGEWIATVLGDRLPDLFVVAVHYNVAASLASIGGETFDYSVGGLIVA